MPSDCKIDLPLYFYICVFLFQAFATTVSRFHLYLSPVSWLLVPVFRNKLQPRGGVNDSYQCKGKNTSCSYCESIHLQNSSHPQHITLFISPFPLFLCDREKYKFREIQACSAEISSQADCQILLTPESHVQTQCRHPRWKRPRRV